MIAVTEDRKTETGTIRISSAALMALDLLRYPQASDGIDNVATVLSDLAEKQLAILSVTMERPVVQRLGHLLGRLGGEALTTPMLEVLQARGAAPWTELERHRAA